MSKLKIHELESFLQVAASGSFRRAAELLNRSPSAVSAHVRQLEEQLEVPLVERTTRRVLLTPEGRLLRERCEQVIEQLDAAAQEVREEAQSRRGRISIGMSPSVSRHHLLPVIAAHHREHPGLSIELHEGFAETLYTHVADGVVDFAIGPGIERKGDFNVRPIIKDKIVAVLPKNFPVDGDGKVALEALAAHPQVCMPRGTAIRSVVERAFRDQGRQLREHFEVMYPQGLFELVEAGMGVAMMPLLSLPAPRQRRFRTAELRGAPLARDICLITWKSRKIAPGAQHLAEQIVQALKQALG